MVLLYSIRLSNLMRIFSSATDSYFLTSRIWLWNAYLANFGSFEDFDHIKLRNQWFNPQRYALYADTCVMKYRSLKSVSAGFWTIWPLLVRMHKNGHKTTFGEKFVPKFDLSVFEYRAVCDLIFLPVFPMSCGSWYDKRLYDVNRLLYSMSTR